VHGRLDCKDLPALYARWPRFGLVSVSDAQRRPLPNAKWLATVQHGVPPSHYAFTERSPREYLAFLGRLAPEKGVDRAVRLALRSGMRLQIAAKVDASDACYFDSVLRPLFKHPAVDFIGEIGDRHKSDFLGRASALLFPIDWPEPFGLVMIEAMACGTPVIAWNRGAVPEIVEDGVTGFVVNSEEEALRAIARARDLDRRRVRAAFERRFTAEEMARAYLDVYEDCLLHDRGPHLMHAADEP
jgi:glycosyltransferase involved in cell wall biosynthesis